MSPTPEGVGLVSLKSLSSLALGAAEPQHLIDHSGEHCLSDGVVEKAPPAAFSLLGLKAKSLRALNYINFASDFSLPAALPVERRVLARLGWAGQTTKLFEQSLLPKQKGLVARGRNPPYKKGKPEFPFSRE